MNLNLNVKLAEGYSSKSQIARVLTENWVKENAYCPSCGYSHLNKFENNRPAADFFCRNCSEEFELKGKKGRLTGKIADGRYSTMIERINSANNPNFLFLTYTEYWSVNNFLIIPKQFFTNDIIIKRNPLARSAKQAGWVGCNIDISRIAGAGKLFLVKNAKLIDRKAVKEAFRKTIFLRETTALSKGWLLDVMNCIDSLQKEEFTLDEIYSFKDKLKLKYPDNNFIKDKIRQQLQILRDKGLIYFLERGRYRKAGYE